MRGTEQKTTLELKLEKLRLICERSPDNAIGLLALAETAFRRGLRLEALEAYQKVLKDESVAEAHLCMAQMYRHHGLYQEAISELRVLFEMEPGYPEAHVFARQLAVDTTLPADIEEILLAGCGNDELALARVRLSIARSLVLREGQELVAIQDANAGDPTFGYYICETRKRLTYCEEVLSQLAVLEDARKAYLADLDRQRQIERERQRASESQVDANSQEGVAITAALEEPLLGGPDYVDATTGELEEFTPAVEAQEVYEAPDVYEAPEVQDEEVQEVQQVQEEVEPDAYLEVGAQDQVVYEGEPVQPEEEIYLEAPIESQAEPVAVEPEPGGYAPEPALWDDHPTYVAPTPIHDSGEASSRDHQHDLTLDLTPTLEGSLPEGPTEITSAPGALWDDEPGYEAPPPLVGMALQYEPGLGDDLAGPELVETIPLHLESQPLLQPDPPAIYEPAPEPEPVPLPVEPDFAGLYAPLLAGLDGLIQTLAKTRSVSSVFLLNREGYTIAEQVKDTIGRERLSEFIIETVSFLEAFASAPQYWVLECAGGIVVIQSVDSYHYLITIGQTGANFGALRYTMDRVRPNFEQVLQPACPA